MTGYSTNDKYNMERPIVEYLEYNNISYQKAWDIQTAVHNEIKQNKLDWRSLSSAERATKQQLHKLIFCEHDHVYTLGKSGSIDHLLLDEGQLEGEDIEFYKINRGGDITYHGPGQITGYPIFDMDEFYTDIHRYVRMLEECIIRLLATYDIVGDRIPDYTGVWIKPTDPDLPNRKICAIGVHLSRWVTMHGFAVNVNTDLSYFGNIIPCGIVDRDKTVTSIANELSRNVEMEEVKDRLKAIFAAQFKFEYK